MRKLPDFSMDGSKSILCPEDCGLVNGHITLNGWLYDIAAIRCVYAPPLFSDNFRLNLRFDHRRQPATGNTWEPFRLTRKGRVHGVKIETQLFLLHGKSGAIMRIELKNASRKSLTLPMQLEVTGCLSKAPLWGFSKPVGAKIARKSWNDGVFALNSNDGIIGVASSISMRPKGPLCSGVLDLDNAKLAPNARVVFYVFLAVGIAEEAHKMLLDMRRDPEKCCRQARDGWEGRVKVLYERMPEFSSDNKALERLYNRSLMHLLLNEWNTPAFKLRPYYGTGGINGGCVGCYLWNYGEPYRLWSILNPKSAREHLKAFLNLELDKCFAFNPDDCSPFGPYYPVNQEKVIFLAHAYVLQTGDVAFLAEKLNGKTILEHVLEQAMMHDDLSKPAVLVDYGNGNHHLELRRELHYDGIAPDLNLRRCVNYRLADELCRIAGVTPPVDLVKRAEDLKAFVKAELFDEKSGWYRAINSDGTKYLRYTMQIFKALGWGDWAMDAEEERALLHHLMNPDEFLGEFGLHSLSKTDPAYDEFDIDNGGPGSCVSFTPAIIDRLYASGKTDEAAKLLSRLEWLGKCLPYWGDSQRADIPEYRMDTPLQNDIQGTAIAQSIIFGVFGIKIRPDFSLEIRPSLPKGASNIHLKNLRLLGHAMDIHCSNGMFTVKSGHKSYHAKQGETIQFSILNAQCSIKKAKCSMLNAQCSIKKAKCSMLN